MSLPAFTRPPLDRPLVIDLAATGYWDTDNKTLNLSGGEDVLVRYPRERRVGHLSIRGARNVAIIGGYNSIGKKQDGTYPGTGARQSGDFNLEIRDGDDGGTVWVEGMMIDATGGAQSDAFFINAPNRLVDLVHCRVEGLLGSLTHGRHADGIQTAGGCRRLRLDHCTIASHYNTVYLRRENSPLMPAVQQLMIRYSNTFGYSTNPAAGSGDPQYTLRGISLGTQPADNDCNQWGACGPANDMSATNADLPTECWFDHFWIDPASAGRQPLEWVFPDAGARTYPGIHPVLDSSGGLYWPAWRASGKVHGRIMIGRPRYGDFAKAADTGLNYKAAEWAA